MLQQTETHPTSTAHQPSDKKRIWANLLHLGYNMWGDNAQCPDPPKDHFVTDIHLWNELTEKSAAAGLNMIVIDLGEAVRYESHPELGTVGAWSVDRLREELVRLRNLGLEPIPKLNFSACHDYWLGEYARMVSTPKYYEVCSDLIKEVSAIFDYPRFFHLGYDEEGFPCQASNDFILIRQGELWWHDFLYIVGEVEKQGVRPWIWSDYYWEHPEEFLNRMPKSVIQSNWYYGEDFTSDIIDYKTYKILAEAGFDEIPTGSNWEVDTNFRSTVEYCRKNIPEKQLMGFMVAPWYETTQKFRQIHLNAIDQIGEMVY